MDVKNSFLRALPAVDRILQEEPLQKIANRIPHGLLLEVSRESIDHFREKIIASSSGEELENLAIDPAVIAAEAAERARLRFFSGLRHVINATGVILHTNLGRAPLANRLSTQLHPRRGSIPILNFRWKVAGGIHGWPTWRGWYAP